MSETRKFGEVVKDYGFFKSDVLIANARLYVWNME